MSESRPQPSTQEILQKLRQEIAIAMDQAERGELFDGEEVFRELLERIEAPKPQQTHAVQSPPGSR